MGKVINGIVIDDDLFQEYHKFQKGTEFDKKKIRQLLHYYKRKIVSNIKQYKSGKTKCARFEKRNVQKSGKTKRSKNFAHTTL